MTSHAPPQQPKPARSAKTESARPVVAGQEPISGSLARRARAGAVLSAVRDVLAGHRGEDNAIVGSRLVCLVREMIGERVAVRRVQEAVKELRRTRPVCGLSSRGYWLPETPEELERSVAEKRGRALDILADLRIERRQLAEMRGQQRIREEVVA